MQRPPNEIKNRLVAVVACWRQSRQEAKHGQRSGDRTASQGLSP
ncbi:MAG: hypothetical protein R3E42_09600 [Burkholderiaceae bacterium]